MAKHPGSRTRQGVGRVKARTSSGWPRFTRLAIHIRTTLYGVHHASVERMVMHNFLIDASRK